MPDQVKKDIEYFESLKEDRSTLDELYDDLVKYFMLPYGKDAIDGTVIGHWCLETLASFLHTSLTNPAMKWISLKSGIQGQERETPLMEMIQKTEDIIYDTFSSPETRFNTASFENYLSLGCFGTGVMHLNKDDINPFGLYYRHLPIKQCYIAENDKGTVDTLGREFELTARNVQNKFDYTMPDKEANEKVKIIHTTFPEIIKNTKNTRWISSYILEEDMHLLYQEELKTFPFAVSRWAKRLDGAYGISPAMIALSLIKAIEQEEKVLKRQAHLAIDPPWAVGPEAKKNMSREPSAINVYSNPQHIPKVMQATGNIQIGEHTLDRKIDQLKKIFYVDQMPLEHKSNMTATEVSIRDRQHTKTMSPITSRTETELLRPLVLKTYEILAQNKLVPEMPKGHKINDLKFEYLSTLAKGQKVDEIISLRNAIELITAAAQIDPTAVDNINIDKFVTEVAYIYNIPLSILRSNNEAEEKDVATIRRERQEMMEQQQAAENQSGMENA